MSTITDVAKRAGTSAATVSHVIHHTRFVSEDLRLRVEEAMEALHYTPKENGKVFVGFLLHSYSCSISEDLIDTLNYYYGDRIEVTAILVPSVITLQELKTYQKRYQLDFIVLEHTVQLKKIRRHQEVDLPIIFLNHDAEEYPLCYHINFDYHAAMASALRHLFSLGHQDILIISPAENPYTNRVVLETCQELYAQYGRKFSVDHILLLDTQLSREEIHPILMDSMEKHPSVTAIITTEMRATVNIVDFVQTLGLSIPQDVSLLAIGDIYLTKFLYCNRTRIDMRIREIRKDIEKIIFGLEDTRQYNVLPEFITGDSTKALVYDQFMRPGASQLSLELSETDILKVRSGNYKVCVSVFDETMPFSVTQMEGLRDGLNTLGIHLVQQTSAHGNYEIQELQIQGFREAKPDAVICLPNMDENKLEPFHQFFPRKTKFLFSSYVPDTFGVNHYHTCITSNSVESGKQASKLLGKYMQGHGLSNVAFLCVGSTSMTANQRDKSALRVMKEEFPEIKLCDVVFYKEESQMFSLLSNLIQSFPQVEALYVSQSRAAETILGVLKLMKRTDIKLVTQGISKNIIDRLSDDGNPAAVVSPNSYEIGRLLAYACARLFLGQNQSPYVAVDPVSFTPENLSRTWLSVMKNKLT